jgi:hypothetical protein
VEKYCRVGQATDENMAQAHCMLDTYACNYTHSGCVILITFSLQQQLHKRALLLRYTYIACLVLFCGASSTYALSVVTHTHKHTHTHTSYSVGLLQTGDQTVAKTSSLTTYNNHKTETSTVLEGFEPAIPTSERP